MGLQPFLPPTNEVWGKVIFLHLFVIMFTGGHAWFEGVVVGGMHHCRRACVVVGVCVVVGGCMVVGGVHS